MPAIQRVSLVRYDPRQLPEITYTRLNRHYRPPVELAKVVLRSMSFELGYGRIRSSAFLVDMNRLFEDFVVVALRETLGLTEHSFVQGGKGHRLCLDDRNQVRLRPDILWWEDGDYSFVGDVKYRLSETRSDLYQLLAYTIAADLPSSLLIYAAGEAAPREHRVVKIEKELHIAVLDPSGTPAAILDEVGRLAQQIRQLRAQASTMRQESTLAA